MDMRLLAAAGGVAAVVVGGVALRSVTSQPPSSPPTEAVGPPLPAEAIRLVDLQRELSPEWNNFVRGKKHAEEMNQHREELIKANPGSRAHQLLPKSVVEPPKKYTVDEFVAFMQARGVRGADVVVYRKGKNGNMAAVKGRDGKVQMLFDYRGFDQKWVAFRDDKDKRLREQHENAFFAVEVPADTKTLSVFVWGPTPPTRLLDTWALDGGFAERERVLK